MTIPSSGADLSAVAAPISAIDPMRLLSDPEAAFTAMRAEGEIVYVPAMGSYWVTSHAVAKDVLTRPGELASRRLEFISHLPDNTILTTDGPEHDRYRGGLLPAVRPKQVTGVLSEKIGPVIDGLLADLAARGAADLVKEFWEPVSVLAFRELFGVPEIEPGRLRRWFTDMAANSANVFGDPAIRARADAAVADIDATLLPILAERERNPDDSMISRLLARSRGETLAERAADILPSLKLTIGAGEQEPGHGGASVLAGLLGAPEALAAFLADPAGTVHAVVDEGLRRVPPIQAVTRYALTDTTIAGVPVPAGAWVNVSLNSANRDERVFGADSAEFRLGRAGVPIAFGAGSHVCIGTFFGRSLIAIALQRLFAALPGLRLDEERPYALAGFGFRAPGSVPCVWDVPPGIEPVTVPADEDSGGPRPGTFVWLGQVTTDRLSALRFWTGLYDWDSRDIEVGEDHIFTTITRGGEWITAIDQLPPMPGLPPVPPNWQCYVCVRDIHEATARAAALGATVLVGPIEVPDPSGVLMGATALLFDPRGTLIALWQPGAHTGFGEQRTDGTWAGTELRGPEPAAAKDFYRELFGWTITDTADGWIATLGGTEVCRARRVQDGAAAWLPALGAADLTAALDYVRAHGGRVLAATPDEALTTDPPGAPVRLLRLGVGHAGHIRPAIPDTAPAADPGPPAQPAPGTPAANRPGAPMTVTKWDLVIATPMGDLPMTAELRLPPAETSGPITGVLVTKSERAELADARLDGDDATWKVKLSTPFPLTLKFALHRDGDTITGTSRAGTFPASTVTGRVVGEYPNVPVLAGEHSPEAGKDDRS
jgi:cytochrome P450/predicted enzyme related to lactoylglutathione lyase